MNTDSRRSKDILREHFLALRTSMVPDEVAQKSRLIHQKLLNMGEFQRAGTVHTYIAMNDRNEVQTRDIVEHSLTEEKRIVVPKMKPKGRLVHLQIGSPDDLSPNHWGVAEPRSGEEVDPSFIDLVLVPMVAGDLSRNRLGYGMGYYDRFLPQTDAIKIGLLFECQLSREPLPAEPFDVSLDLLITEKRVID